MKPPDSTQRKEIIAMKKQITAILCLALAVCTVFSCVSCSVRISANEISSGFSRKSTEKGTVDSEFTGILSGFSMKLFTGCLKEQEKGRNTLVSPLSAIICLGMIADGADGKTKAQIERALGCDTDTLSKNLFALREQLYTSDKCRVNIANSLWIRNDGTVTVKDSFLQNNADWYGAQVYRAPFDDTTVKDINSWCEKHTDGMIKEIIREISSDTLMYLVNALMFDAEWETKYRKNDIKDRSFTDYSGKSTDVKMLFSSGETLLTGDGVTGFMKNYHGGKYSFVGLLPDEGTDVYDFAASLDGEKWTSIWNSRSAEKENGTTATAGIPEFTSEWQMKLNDVLIGMGISDMFDGKADFSRMSDAPLYCSSFSQKTYVKVDRNGTKAAAITWGDMKATGVEPISVDVILDRPFVYAIVDNTTGIPLFIGVTASV